VDLSSAKKAAIRLLTVRDRTAFEIRNRLSEKYSQEIVEEALDYLTEMDFVNDERYAQNYVENRNRTRPTGNSALRYELSNKGITSDIVDKVLNPPEAELELAVRLLTSRAPSLARLSPEVRQRRAYGLLERRGFPWHTAQKAVGQVLDSDLQKD